CTLNKCLEDEEHVNTTGTHNSDGSDVWWVLDTGTTGKVSTCVRTPVADDSENLWFPFVCHYWFPPAKNASICAAICGVVKCCILIAPPGQNPPQVPQPLHLASVTT